MASARQRLREPPSATSNEGPDGGIAEGPSPPRALSTSRYRSTRLSKRDQDLSSGQATGSENGSGEKNAGHTAEVKNGSSERGQLNPATAPGLSPMMTATLTPPLGQFVINLLLQLAGIVAAIAFGIFAVESLNVAKQANIEARIANQVAMLGICTQSNNTLAFCSEVIARKDLVFPNEVASLFSSAVPTGTTASDITTLSSTRTTTTIPNQSSRAPNSTSITSSTSAVATTTTEESSAASSPTASVTNPLTQTLGAPQPSETSSYSASPGPSTRVVIGVVVPVVSIFLVIACTAIYMRRRRLRHSHLSGRPEVVIAENSDTEPLGEGPVRDDRMGKESEQTGRIPPARGLKRWWKVYKAWFLESTVSTR